MRAKAEQKFSGLLRGCLILTAVMCFATPAFAAPVLDAGWDTDVIVSAFTDSVGSPYALVLPGSAFFRITDCCVDTDTYFVYDFGALILTTADGSAGAPLPFASNPDADAAWANPAYDHGEIVLASGAHSSTVQGDGVGGLPAGFYTRLDTAVPEPSTLLLLGSGLLGLAAVRWGRRKRG